MKNEELRASTVDVPQTTYRRLLSVDGRIITPSNETINCFSVGGGSSVKGDSDIVLDEAVHALPNADSDDYMSTNGGRRSMGKTYADLIDIICSSGRTSSLRETGNAMWERLGVGDVRPPDFPLNTQISNRLRYFISSVRNIRSTFANLIL